MHTRPTEVLYFILNRLRNQMYMKNRRQFIKNVALAGAGISALSISANGLPLLKFQPDGFKKLNFKSGLKIKSIESYRRGNAVFVRVRADDGSEGFGQLAPYNTNITVAVLHEMIVQHALGKDPYEIAAIADQCIEANYKFPWSFVCRATSGLETALWDLMGNREKKSVCQLLGGNPKPIPAYGSSMRRDITPRDEAARLLRLRDEQGFEAFKIRVGKVTGHNEDEWPGRTEEIIPAVRKAVGDKITLQADANSCYTADKAIQVGKMLQDHNYFFFEEPCPFWELEWTAEVNAALKMHVAGGEQDNDMAQWRRMVKMNAVDIVQPDLCYIGGISRGMEVAAMAAKSGKTCVPHSANLSMLTLFAMHLMAAIPNPAPHLEYSIEDVEWAKNIFEPALKINNGKVSFPEGAGWGVRINKEWLEKAEYRISEKE